MIFKKILNDPNYVGYSWKSNSNEELVNLRVNEKENYSTINFKLFNALTKSIDHATLEFHSNDWLDNSKLLNEFKQIVLDYVTEYNTTKCKNIDYYDKLIKVLNPNSYDNPNIDFV